MDVQIFSLIIFVSFIGLFLLMPLFRRTITEPRTKSCDHTGKNKAEELATTASDRVILMPDYLRTRDEMVKWMAHDLPRLTMQLHESRRE
jgi:hypothetical protein